MPESGKRKSEKYPHSQHCLNIFNRVLKLYGVGPVDNKPSTNKLHNFVIIIIFSSSSNCDMWHVICDMWHMKCDMWHMKCDMLGGVSFLTLLTVMEKDMFFYTTIVWAKIYLPKKGVNRPKNTSCTKQTPLNYQNYLQVPQKFPKKWKAQDNTEFYQIIVKCGLHFIKEPPKNYMTVGCKGVAFSRSEFIEFDIILSLTNCLLLLLPRPSKCLKHPKQPLCTIFLNGVNLFL